MELIDYINKPENTERDGEGNFLITDDILLANAQTYEEEKLWRIQGQVRKTQVETAVIVYDTLDRLQEQFNDTTETAEIRILAKAVYKALSKLYEYEFYINLGDATVLSMFNNAKALGVLIEPEVEAITAAATYRTKPFEKVTIDQLRLLRYPTTWMPVTVAGGNTQVVTPEGDLISGSNNGAFRFVINTNHAFEGAVKIRILAKKANETVFAYQDSFPIMVNKKWEANTAYAHVFTRALGLSGYRHFKFEYTAPHEGAISSVEVEGVV